tara:strand:+ start:109 stop:717 length:609 start_codon:yes stop_codon:yes gene_type:complete
MAQLTYISQDVIYEFEITGKEPGIMFNNPAMMSLDTKAMTVGKKQYDKNEEAEIRTYRNNTGNLCVPATHIRASILEASKMFKLGRSSAKSVLNHIQIEPFDLIELKSLKNRTIKTYDTDERRVVISRAGIIRVRPVVREWKVRFSVVADESLMTASFNNDGLNAIVSILADAGKKQGIGDYRPQKGGNFGRFEITDAKEII